MVVVNLKTRKDNFTDTDVVMIPSSVSMIYYIVCYPTLLYCCLTLFQYKYLLLYYYLNNPIFNHR